MTSTTNDAAPMCAISDDVENSNDSEDGGSSSIDRNSTEDDGQGQCEANDNKNNNNKNFVLKFRPRQSENPATLQQRSSPSPYRIGVDNDVQAGFVLLPLSASGLAAHTAFKQRQHQQREQVLAQLLKQQDASGAFAVATPRLKRASPAPTRRGRKQ